jgi:hypothetical protein
MKKVFACSQQRNAIRLRDSRHIYPDGNSVRFVHHAIIMHLLYMNDASANESN